MLHPDHDFRFMLVNQMQRDLGSANVLETCASLVAMCKLVTLEMIPALLPRVAEVLTTSEHTLVRKKAVMALHRFYQLDPSSVAHLIGPVKALVRDRDPSVMASALCLLHEFAKQDPHSQLDLLDQYCSILKQITEHRLPREFDYHRMPAPWIQIKLLKILATLAQGNLQASESMYEILGECIKRADSGTNAGFAVAYECVKTIANIWPCEWLLDLAASTISRFIQSDQYNLKFLGVTGLACIVRTNPKYAVQHQLAVIDCLEDPDESLKRITLELLFRMTNAQNVEPVVEKLMHFLKQARDPFLKRDLVDRIIQLADGFAPNSLWFVETMIELLNEEFVSREAVHSLLKLIAEEEEQEVKSRACELFSVALTSPKSSDTMLSCAFWVLGEFAPDKHSMLNQVCEVLETREMAVQSRLNGISAIGKLLAYESSIPTNVRRLLERKQRGETQIEQRSNELIQLFELGYKVGEILPEDASCEDFEQVEFSFLDEFASILRAAGASEYQPRLKIMNDSDYLDDFAPSTPSPGEHQPQQQTLRFSAYEAPTLHFQPELVAAAPPPPPTSVFSPHHHSVAMSATSAAAVPKVKNLWGPTGYAGNVSAPQQQVAAFTAATSARKVVPPPPSSYDFGGEYEENDDVPQAFAGTAGQPPARLAAVKPPAPVVAKPKELTEKEKAAMALFGGGMSSSSKSTPTKSSAKSTAVAPTAAAPTAAPAAVADLLSLEEDLFAAPLPQQPPRQDLMSLMEPVAAPSPPPKPQVPLTSIMDLYSSPTPKQQQLPAAISSAPVLPPKQQLLLTPKPNMTTPQFGTLWGTHTAEVRLSVTKPSTLSLQVFLGAQTSKLGCTLVEFIPATSEAILAGGLGQETVLFHAKDMGHQVDFTIKSKLPNLTQQVAREMNQ
ncbi:hypothetical protein BASA81_007764 [Batrachochytrium salamandrivorans]|nr:hypothetical protein BASA81_007764 [Batrachochytrium salamandrivorans]